LGGFSPGLDPDAKAYINAVVSDGATVSDDQKEAINTFYKTGKSEGWYSSLKRMYLPIWALETPNEICMVSGTSGTFTPSGITHAAGYVEGNGFSGYFNFGVDPVTLGLTVNGASAFWGCYAKPTANGRVHIGSYVTSPTKYLIALRNDALGEQRVIPFCDTTTAGVDTSTTNTGIFVAARSSSTACALYREGDITVGTATINGAVPDINVFGMARNNQGVADLFSSGRYFAFGLGLDASAAGAKSLADAIKTLWETCTGLTLP
jgi:hypothetical protein